MKALIVVVVLGLGGAGLALAAGAPATPPTTSDLQTQMQQNYARMQALMQQIHGSQGAQRHEMMQQHWTLMHSQMGLMQQMMGPGAGGMSGNGMMHGGGMHGSGMASAGTGPADCAQSQQRMEYMQQMMNQMLQQEKVLLESPKS